MTQPNHQNLLLILSDEHNRSIAGCYGHPLVQTPNLDALAARGTRFTSAYCNSPICVPSRASLATGQYPHEVRCWDNATPYGGQTPSWHSLLREEGIDAVSIGKLHFRGGDDYGFTEELLPLHVVDGVGDLKGLFRKELLTKAGAGDLAAQAGRGTSSYSQYDHRIAARAREWLGARKTLSSKKPFVLFVSFVMPHFPLIAPEEFYDLYERFDLETLSHGLRAPPPDHPTLNRMRHFLNYDTFFDDESRARALRAYFGMVSCLDSLIGSVTDALEINGFGANTRILYTSDHGDNLGKRGFWGKSNMYEDSVGVPMILAGDGVPSNAVVDCPVSLLDVAPTTFHCTGAETIPDYPGRSLIELANEPRDRVVMAEYHAVGSDTGQFMIRRGRWKYVHYVGARPQLFDLQSDPEELHDLSDSPDHAQVQEDMLKELQKICDPDETDAMAFADQAAVIAAHGGKDGIADSADIPFTPPPA